MRLFTWLIRLALFIVLLGFALSNTDSVSLRFFGIPDFVWRAPLVLFLLLFFAAGTLIGVLSSMPAVFRQRRQVSRLRKDLARAQADAQLLAPVPVASVVAGTGAGAGVSTASVGTGSQLVIARPAVPESGIRGL